MAGTLALAGRAFFRQSRSGAASLTWAGGTWAVDESVVVRTQGPEDFLLIRLVILPAILRSEAEVSARQWPLAISAAPGLRNRRREVLVAPWAGGIRLETRPVGQSPRRLAPRGTRWAADGIHSATSPMVAGRKCIAATGGMNELTASGIRLEMQEMRPLARMLQDSRLPVRATQRHQTHARPTWDSARIAFRQVCRDRRGSRHFLPAARWRISEALASGDRASAVPISEAWPSAVRASPIRSSGRIVADPELTLRWFASLGHIGPRRRGHPRRERTFVCLALVWFRTRLKRIRPGRVRWW